MAGFEYILDRMRSKGFQMPGYVGQKTADTQSGASYHSSELKFDSQENVWLSAVKIACLSCSGFERGIYTQRLYDAADRYRIRGDIEKAAAFIRGTENEKQDILTESDWHKAALWLHKNASFMQESDRRAAADCLMMKSAEIGYVPSLAEKYTLDKLAGRNPVSDDIRRLADDNLHKLASGSVYRTDQFESLPYKEVHDFLPDLMRQASFGLPVLQPSLFARAAVQADEVQADVLDKLMRKHGQVPVHSARHLPVEINDQILAAL
jgi:hypothetical protein